MNEIQIILIAILFVLQLLDSYTTRMILGRGGRELNPVARRMMDLLGVTPYLTGKVIAVTIGGWSLINLPYGTALLSGVVVWYALVTAYNRRSL